jgi:hypothetical protein
MNLADTLRGLWRRWYIVLPGILITAALAAGAWSMISPGHVRSSTQLLIPGPESMPAGSNPYLFLGGLSPAADVLVRAAGSENARNEVVEDYPGVEIEISRDVSTAGPIILISVTAASDGTAQEVLELLIEQTSTTLDELQETENIAPENRVTLLPITVDSQSVLYQRSRFIAVAATGLVGMALTLFVAGLVDGLSRRRKRRGHPDDEQPASEGRNAPEPEPIDESALARHDAETLEQSPVRGPSSYEPEPAPDPVRSAR